MAIRKRIILAWCLAQSVFWSLWLGCNSKNIPYTIYIVVICIVQTAKVQDFPPKSTPFPPTNPTTNTIFPQEISSEIPPNPFPQPFPGHGLRGRRLRPGRAGNGAGGADPAAAEVGGCRVHLGASAHGMAAALAVSVMKGGETKI